MTIEQRTSAGVILLDLHGRMTIEVGRSVLTERVRELLQEGHKRILVNAADIPQVDTSGLCDLVEAYLAVTRRDGSLKLACLAPRLRRVLEITRLLTIIEEYPSEAEALASFGSGAAA
jgi:anti-anti-sigma factor